MLSSLKRSAFTSLLFGLTYLLASSWAMAQTTAFTYQGKLTSGGSPANGQYDLQFKLFDTATLGTGTQQGGTYTVINAQATEGIFTVQLDFGAAVFNGNLRFLEIGVRPGGSFDQFTLLSPRQPVTSAPYAVKSASADTATNSAQLGGLAASGFIQNSTSPQGATNFNITGTGTAGILDASTQFNLGGTRILGNAGSNNLFVGVDAGASNTTGNANTFVGKDAGFSNTTGVSNSFFGYHAGTSTTSSHNSFFGDAAGYNNTTGGSSFFGYLAGFSNTTGLANSFFGKNAGRQNTGGEANSFFGDSAGFSNTTGLNNSFFGRNAGYSNTEGYSNSFFGEGAGNDNTTAGLNSFFGRDAGHSNTTGGSHSFFGANAGLLNNAFCCNSFFGADAGMNNTTGTSNSFFGAEAGQNTSTGGFNSFFGHNAGRLNTTSNSNSFFGDSAGEQNTGGGNSFFGGSAGQVNTTGSSNSIFGNGAGLGITTGNNITVIGARANAGANNLDHATVIGADAVVSASNTVVLGRSADTVQIPGVLNVSGTFGANILNAATQFNLGGSRILGNAGTNNVFAGIGAGASNTGTENSFFGNNAGQANTSGAGNSFFGVGSGLGNAAGNNITLVGARANVGANSLAFATAVGADAVVSTSNTLVLGRSADTVQIPGALNVSGAFGANILNAATQFNLGGNRILSNAGTNNLFAGIGSGTVNTGSSNAFFGVNAGGNNTTGGGNSFFGSNAGQSNIGGSSNAFFGQQAGANNTTGAGNSFFGLQAGNNNTTGAGNSFFGISAGWSITTGSGNTFVGNSAGLAFISDPAGQLATVNNTVLGDNALVNPAITNATAIGARAYAIQNNSLVLGSINGSGFGTADTNVGIGTNNPQARLHIRDTGGNILFTRGGCLAPLAGIWFASTVTATCQNYTLLGGDGSTYINRPLGGSIVFSENNGPQMTIRSGGFVVIEALGAAGTPQSTLCRNAAHEIALCSSSRRYKKDVKPFDGGLQLIHRLQPVTFTWKASEQPDIGLIAEEVAEVEPRLAFKNKDGEIEGVSYSQLSVVLIDAVKEQQSQIRALREQLDALTKLLCQATPHAAVCKGKK